MSEMQSENLFRCRTCLNFSTEDKVFRIYEVAAMIMSYTTLEISENDGLPPDVCMQCYEQAKQAYQFKLLCENSDEILRQKEISQCQSSNDVNLISVDSKDKIDGELCKLKESNKSCPESNECLNNNKSFHNEGTKDVVKTESSNEHIKENYSRCSKRDIKTKDFGQKLHKNVKQKHFKCKFCDITFLHKTRYRKHEQKHESGISCYKCGKNYSTSKQLASHISIHNRKGAHLCQTCGKQFTMPENLKRHQRIHNGVRPYECTQCYKSFTQSNELKSHMITHSSDKLHLCSICGNKYARHMSLRVHMRRLHSNSLRSYACATCGRSFKDPRDLSQHKTIHTGERSHICKVCNKAFNRSSNLKVHERIHTGYRPYVCHICQRAFIQKHVLDTHLKTHPYNTYEL